ncbi:hypothetical protein BRD18_05770 [Halobacteriales archaeon SW_7_71_33]|nr:MAG: hypothetical protein BRD18_05770 [Halobacteriales archaeon SW_7_71_33]
MLRVHIELEPLGSLVFDHVKGTLVLEYDLLHRFETDVVPAFGLSACVAMGSFFDPSRSNSY